jgi:hypothetical protein
MQIGKEYLLTRKNRLKNKLELPNKRNMNSVNRFTNCRKRYRLSNKKFLKKISHYKLRKNSLEDKLPVGKKIWYHLRKFWKH